MRVIWFKSNEWKVYFLNEINTIWKMAWYLSIYNLHLANIKVENSLFAHEKVYTCGISGSIIFYYHACIIFFLSILFKILINFRYNVSHDFSSLAECSSKSPPATVIFLILLIFEALLFAIFTCVMFGTQVQAIWNDETVCITFIKNICLFFIFL